MIATWNIDLIDTNWNERLRPAMDRAKAERKITQTRIADALGVKQASVSDWRSGKKKPELERINQLCELLDISSAWLLFGDRAILVDEEYGGRVKNALDLYDRFSNLPQPVRDAMSNQIDIVSSELGNAGSTN